jgi:hypothetical protein
MLTVFTPPIVYVVVTRTFTGVVPLALANYSYPPLTFILGSPEFAAITIVWLLI